MLINNLFLTLANSQEAFFMKNLTKLIMSLILVMAFQAHVLRQIRFIILDLIPLTQMIKSLVQKYLMIIFIS